MSVLWNQDISHRKAGNNCFEFNRKEKKCLFKKTGYTNPGAAGRARVCKLETLGGSGFRVTVKSGTQDSLVWAMSFFLNSLWSRDTFLTKWLVWAMGGTPPWASTLLIPAL